MKRVGLPIGISPKKRLTNGNYSKTGMRLASSSLLAHTEYVKVDVCVRCLIDIDLGCLVNNLNRRPLRRE